MADPATSQRVQRFGLWRALAIGALGLLFFLFITVLFRTFAFQPYQTPSTSMHPTLLEGDYFWAAKLSYGYSRYSLPFSPRLSPGRVFASEPRYGDVVVFRLPRDDSVDYIKRVVGLPGDRVQMINSVLTINGTPVRRERLDDCDQAAIPATGRFRCWRETLPNGASHAVLDAEETGILANTREYVVPPGHYFMMGDNRDNSNDSRIPASQGGVGFVPFENLVGRATIIFLSIKQSAPDEPATLRLDRIGMVIR